MPNRAFRSTVTLLRKCAECPVGMTPEPGDGQRPRIAASVPTNHKQALDYAADKRSQPGSRTYTASIVREAIGEWLARHSEELPPEARDLLDEDLEANGGKGELTVEIEEDVEA